MQILVNLRVPEHFRPTACSGFPVFLLLSCDFFGHMQAQSLISGLVVNVPNLRV
jgi:hypothetical protein